MGGRLTARGETAPRPGPTAFGPRPPAAGVCSDPGDAPLRPRRIPSVGAGARRPRTECGRCAQHRPTDTARLRRHLARRRPGAVVRPPRRPGPARHCGADAPSGAHHLPSARHPFRSPTRPPVSRTTAPLRSSARSAAPAPPADPPGPALPGAARHCPALTGSVPLPLAAFRPARRPLPTPPQRSLPGLSRSGAASVVRGR